MGRKRGRKKMNRAEKKMALKDAILKVFADYKMIGVQRPHLTARKLATNLGRTPAPSFRRVLDEMNEIGLLECVVKDLKNGKEIYFFALMGEGLYQSELAGFNLVDVD